MRLQNGEAGLSKEGGGEAAKRLLPDEFKDCGPDAAFCGCQEPLPLGAVLLKQLLPSVERFKRDFKDLADPFHRTQVHGVLCQYPEDEEKAVAAVRDDGIRQDGMGRRRLAIIADQATDTKVGFFGMTVNEIDQGTAIISVYMHLALASAVRTGLRLRPEAVHAFL